MYEEFKQLLELTQERMEKIKYKIMIVSGKGGVGKSFIASSLAIATSLKGKKVGLLDADIHGPSIPKILGLERQTIIVDNEGSIIPVKGPKGVSTLSIQYLLPSEDSPVIWRGPLKSRVILEMLAKVNWGSLDYLYIDLPPGTGDEALSVAQYITQEAKALIITMPSELSKLVVKKAVKFCYELRVPVIGVIENMRGFTCPKCGSYYNIFSGNAGEAIAKEEGIPYLGSIPIDPRISECIDRGEPFILKYPNALAAKAIFKICEEVINRVEGK
mgnify:CR=1 FL=1